MNQHPLVSIITPCYNGANYLQRFMDSVLNQSYSNMEFIFINDGSSDDTERIARSFERHFLERGIQYHYIYQHNAGQAAAINRGLSIMQGTYLTWPDSDDWMTEDCIEKKVAALEKHPEWAMVCCKTAVVHENDITKIVDVMERRSMDSEHFFDDLITENDVYFAPGGYMVRAAVLKDKLQDGRIFAGRGGQNWQLLLPVAYQNDCGFLPDILYYYLVRDSSHSHSVKEYEDQIERSFVHQKILTETIERMKIERVVKDRYLDIIAKKYTIQRFDYAYRFKKKADLSIYYREMNAQGLTNKEIKRKYYLTAHKTTNLLLRFTHLPVGLFNRIKRQHMGK